MYVYDYIIIGTGIAGLYTAYKLKKKYPNATFLVLEKSEQIGGRLLMELFEGKLVECGAGVGRYKKDHRLKKLLQNVGMPFEEVPVKISYNFKNPSDILQNIEFLKQFDLDRVRRKYTFKEFFIRIFGKTAYERFIKSGGYTDFENADVKDTVYDYGFDDNTEKSTIFFVDWMELARRLAKFVGESNIILDYDVKSIRKYKGLFEINKKLKCKNLVFATDISLLKKYKNRKYKKVTNGVKCQSFIRVYAKLDGKINLDSVIHSNTPLQKIIDMGDNILMIAYADNKSADRVNKMNRRQLQRLLAKNGIHNKILTFKKYYWKCGTHYYKPLSNKFKNRQEFIDYAQHPENGVFVVGEWVSRNQGWVEGALESVDKIFEQII